MIGTYTVGYAILAGRLLLSAVLLFAAVGKLFDRTESRRAIENLGIPNVFAGWVTNLLPVIEAVLVVALLASSSARMASAAASFLFITFTVVVVINLARGNRSDCRCFGNLSSGPIGWPTALRNLMLACIAVSIVWKGGDSIGPNAWTWLARLNAGQVLTWAACVTGIALVAGPTVLLFSLLRRYGQLLLRVEEVERHLERREQPGRSSPVRRAPSFRLPALTEGTVSLEDLLLASRPLLLVFTNPRCGPCLSLLPQLSHWQREHENAVTIAIISDGSVQDNRKEAARHHLNRVLLQDNREVSDAFGVHGTPGAVLLAPDGSIIGPAAYGADAIRDLITRALRISAEIPQVISGDKRESRRHALPQQPRSGNPTRVDQRRSAPKQGELPPRLGLRDLRGKTVSLANFRNIETLVLFFNPRCGFCQQMLNDLRAWEADRPFGAPELLVVSTGSIEENRALHLRSTLVIDPDWTAASAFGANGTPTAVLIDADGRIASDIVAGSAAVFALANTDRELSNLAHAPGQP
jgi:peroxiredoxin